MGKNKNKKITELDGTEQLTAFQNATKDAIFTALTNSLKRNLEEIEVGTTEYEYRDKCYDTCFYFTRKSNKLFENTILIHSDQSEGVLFMVVNVEEQKVAEILTTNTDLHTDIVATTLSHIYERFLSDIYS